MVLADELWEDTRMWGNRKNQEWLWVLAGNYVLEMLKFETNVRFPIGDTKYTLRH